MLPRGSLISDSLPRQHNRRRLIGLLSISAVLCLISIGGFWNGSCYQSRRDSNCTKMEDCTKVGTDTLVSSVSSNRQVDSTTSQKVHLTDTSVQVNLTDSLHVNPSSSLRVNPTDNRQVNPTGRHVLSSVILSADEPQEDESLECVRTDRRSDYCIVKGDVRLDQRYNLFVLYSRNASTQRGLEKIKPYTRKGDPFVSGSLPEFTIYSVDAPEDADVAILEPEIESNSRKEETKNSSFPWVTQPEDILRDVDGNRLDPDSHWSLFKKVPGVTPGLAKNGSHSTLHCDVKHNATVVVFSTGGYTGNLYHEFADGLIPLHITTRKYKGEVIIAIAEWHYGWLRKYKNVISQMSNYEPLLLGKSKEVNCFPGAVVGQISHDEFMIDSEKMPNKESMQDFQKLLSQAFLRYPVPFYPFEPQRSRRSTAGCDPILTIIVRRGSRVLLNTEEVVLWAQSLGFLVRVIEPDHYKPLQHMWKILQETAVTLGVHGAAMSHFVFLRPQSVFIQLVPLATVWPSATYYGNPSIELGIQYIGVNLSIAESSLSKLYPPNDPVLTDPVSVYVKYGYGKVKEIYMDGQNVTWSQESAIQTLQKAKDLLQKAVGQIEMSDRDRRCKGFLHQKILKP